MELSSLTILLPASFRWLGRNTIESLPLNPRVALIQHVPDFEEKPLLDNIIIIAINPLTFPSIYAIFLGL